MQSRPSRQAPRRPLNLHLGTPLGADAALCTRLNHGPQTPNCTHTLRGPGALQGKGGT